MHLGHLPQTLSHNRSPQDAGLAPLPSVRATLEHATRQLGAWRKRKAERQAAVDAVLVRTLLQAPHYCDQ
jgi:hypothetical protein